MDLSKLEGLISPEAGEALSNLAASVRDDLAIVEIGSYKGKSTCYLAQGSKDVGGAQVYAIDPWDSGGNEGGRFGFDKAETREAFEDQIREADLADYITPIVGYSHSVGHDWMGPDIGLLFIDGDHSRESVIEDFNAFKDYLIKGESLVVFDDYTEQNPGVIEAIEEDLIHLFSHSKVEAPGLFRARYEGD